MKRDITLALFHVQRSTCRSWSAAQPAVAPANNLMTGLDPGMLPNEM